MRVLIVDDSRAMRMILRKTLRSAGYQHFKLSEATDGRSAMRMIEEQPPDLVMTDWNMPHLNGAQFMQQLRDTEYEGMVGVVSSAVSPEMSVQARELGARFVIAKPFKVSTVLTMLQRAGLEPSAPAEFESLHGQLVRSFDIRGMRGVLSGVYRRPLEFVEADPMDLRRIRNVTIGTYLNLEGQIAAIGVMELRLSLSLAGGLSLVPVGRVRDLIQSRDNLPDNMQENLTEVFNLMSGLLADEHEYRMRIDRIETRAQRVPVRLRIGARSGRRLDVHVTVEGYEGGRASLFMLKPPIARGD